MKPHLKVEWQSNRIQLRTFILIIFCLTFSFARAQDAHIMDSLKQLIGTSQSDTAMCHSYLLWGEELYLNKPDTAVTLWLKAREIAAKNLNTALDEKLKNIYLEYYSSALNNIGYIYDDQGKIQMALEAYLECMQIKRELGNKKGVATALNNIGYIYKNLGDIATALDYYHKSLQIREELGKPWDIGNSVNNIGSIYDDQGDIPKALQYYERSLAINQDLKDSAGIALGLSNIGLVYKNQGDIPKALEYFFKSLEIREKINHRYGIAVSLNNIGAAYSAKGELDKSLEYFYKCMKVEEEIGDKNGMAHTLNYVGSIYLVRGDVSWANTIGEDMMSISRDLGNPMLIGYAALLLMKTAKGVEDYKKALEMHELHIQMRDSINNEATQKATVRQQTKYEFEKEALVKEQEVKEQERLDAEKTTRRDNLQYSIVFIFLLVVGTGVAMLSKLSLSTRVTEGLVFFSFLIFFEFMLVLADPYIETWSAGAPGIKLLFNACIAAFIFPLHAFFESTLKSKLAK